MNAALIYRSNNRKLVWSAFACAIAIHVTAVALAENKSKPVLVTWGVEPDDPVIGTFGPPPQPQEPEAILPPEPTAIEDRDFVDEDMMRPPIRPRKKTPVASVIRSNTMGTGTATSPGSVKAFTLFAPRPNYPYEARRSGTTGSGVAQLKVNSSAGNVVDAQMVRSTGSAILDSATLEALKRWRFRPGVAENVAVPITYTLTGVSY